MGLLDQNKTAGLLSSAGVSKPVSLTNPFSVTAQSTPVALPQSTSLPFTFQNLKDTITGLPKAGLDTLQSLGQASLRGAGAIASAVTKKPFTPTGQFQKDLYGTDKPITLTSFGRETRFADPNKPSAGLFKNIDPAIGLFAGLADAISGGEEVRGLFGLGKNARRLIAESQDVEQIATLLKKEVPQMSEQTAKGFAHIFREVNDVNEVDSAINKISFEYNKAGKRVAESKPLQLPKEIQTKAQTDWEHNFADEYGLLSDRAMEIQNEIKGASKADVPALQAELDSVVKKGSQMENTFVEKWKSGGPNKPAGLLGQAETSVPDTRLPQKEGFYVRNTIKGQEYVQLQKGETLIPMKGLPDRPSGFTPNEWRILNEQDISATGDERTFWREEFKNVVDQLSPESKKNAIDLYYSVKSKGLTMEEETNGLKKIVLELRDKGANAGKMIQSTDFGNTPNIAETIAKSKDPTEIAKILETTGVDKSQIPSMSKVLANIDNPKKVNTIIEGFDTTRAPKKPVQLPPKLEAKQTAIEMKKQALEMMQLKPLEKYVAKSGNMKGSLPELGVGTSKFAKQGDTIIDNTVGHGKYAEDVRTQFENVYMPAKKEVQKLEAELKQEVKALKYSSEGVPLALNARQKVLLNSGDVSKTTQSIPLVQGEQGEVRSIEIQAQQARSILEGEEIPSGVSLPEIIANTVTPVKSRVNIIDTYLRTPDRVMQKIGFGKEAKEIRHAMDEYWKELPKNIQKIENWAKEVPKESNARVFKYLDGQAITLRPDELKVGREIKTWLREWADRLGLAKDERVSDYITRIFDNDFTEKSFPEEIAKLIADKIPGSVYNPFTLRRLGVKGYRQDTWKALDAYVKRGTRKVWLDPVLENIQSKAGSSLELSNIEKSQWQYIKKYTDNINMRPTDLDESIDNVVRSVFGDRFGQRPVTSITKLLRQMTFRGMLGFNVGSSLRNISQGINTYAVLGEKYTALGYASLLKKGAMAELNAEGVLNAGFIQDKVLSATAKKIETMDKALFFFFDTAEKINRGSAYFGAKAKGLSLGFSEEKAIEYGKFVVRKTQFSFDSVDTPVGMQSDIMKTLLQFQSFTTKQLEFLTEMVKDKNFTGLLRYAVAGLVFVYTIGKMFGMKPKELLPIYRFDTPPSLKLPVELIKAAADSPDQYGNQRTINTKVSDILKTLPGLIPGGSQGKKTYQGVTAVNEGGSYTKAGNKQFDVGGSTAKDIQAYIFGKYAGQEAQNYYDKVLTKEEQAYKDAVAQDKEQSVQEKKAIMPIYNKVQKLNDAGKVEEAQAMVNDLSDADYEIYKKIRTAEKSKETIQGKKDMFPTFQKVQELKAAGKIDEAQKIVNDLTDDQYRYYELIKKQLDNSASVQTDSGGNILSFIFGEAKVASASAVPPDYVPPDNSHWIRNNEIKDSDLEEAKAILFGEISNRSTDKQLIEAQSILNTAFNRMDEYARIGKPKTLTEILHMPNIYQAYNDKQYTKYKSGVTDTADQQKIDVINTMIAKIKNGTFQNNIGKRVRYHHLSDGRIVVTNEKLFK